MSGPKHKVKKTPKLEGAAIPYRDCLYHITPSQHLGAILREGLRCDGEGCIYVMTDPIVANSIAGNQIMTDRYAIIAVAPAGITGEISRDDVAEFTAPYHRVVRQRLVSPEYLEHIVTLDTIHDRPTEWDYHVGARIYGQSREMVDDEFRARSLQPRGRVPRGSETATLVRKLTRRPKSKAWVTSNRVNWNATAIYKTPKGNHFLTYDGDIIEPVSDEMVAHIEMLLKLADGYLGQARWRHVTGTDWPFE